MIKLFRICGVAKVATLARQYFKLQFQTNGDTNRHIGGQPYMTSALRGEWGGSPKEDVVREVA